MRFFLVFLTLIFFIQNFTCNRYAAYPRSNRDVGYEYNIDQRYLGHPDSWGSSAVSYMYAAAPAANFEAGPFVRPSW